MRSSSRDLTEIVMVGHSGGGPAIQYAADRLAESTRRVVFLDAWVLHDGEAIHDVLPKALVEHDRAAAQQSPDQTLAMNLDVWTRHFMNGATPEQVAEVADRLALRADQPSPFLDCRAAVQLCVSYVTTKACHASPSSRWRPGWGSRASSSARARTKPC
jgi:pimeloyl-ACP methyl ester carboxylesterase